jgi:hypothetical protein
VPRAAGSLLKTKNIKSGALLEVVGADARGAASADDVLAALVLNSLRRPKDTVGSMSLSYTFGRPDDEGDACLSSRSGEAHSGK